MLDIYFISAMPFPQYSMNPHFIYAFCLSFFFNIKKKCVYIYFKLCNYSGV